MSDARERSTFLSQRIAWLGLEFTVPEDWQIVRHGLSPEQGNLVLIDRRVQRLTLSWAQCRSEPNLRRLLDDYKSKQREQEDGTQFEDLRVDRYRGFSHTGSKGERLCRLVRYEAEHRRLLELLLIEPEGFREPKLLEGLARSVELSEKPGSCRRWAAFGIDVETPPHFRLVGTDIKPADVSFAFVRIDEKSGNETKTEASLRRLGMAASWHDGDLAKLAKKHEPKARFREVLHGEHDGGPAVELSGIEAGPPLPRMLRLLRALRVFVFHCPQENAVYELSTKSPPKRPVSPRDFRLRLSREVA